MLAAERAFAQGAKVEILMDPKDAAFATREMLRPRHAIPIHYGTFPVLRGTPQGYQAALGQSTTQVYPIHPGDKLEF